MRSLGHDLPVWDFARLLEELGKQEHEDANWLSELWQAQDLTAC